MEHPILPSFGHGCITDLLAPFLAIGGDAPLPATYPTSGARVLFVLDGLGWEQLLARPELAPTLSTMVGGPITTVAPSTTATALTSITTGLTPSEHGIVGYRMMVDDSVLNCLRWATGTNNDARTVIPPAVLQPISPFMGEAVSLVTKADFKRSGFSEAHLRGGSFVGYRTSAILVHEIARQVREGEKSVYAYYDGIDKVSHEYGLGSYYDAELAFADRLVADVIEAVPSGTTVLVTADHGQVDCGGNLVGIADEVLANTAHLSGEGRFRWLHAQPGRAETLYEAAVAYHGIDSWVVGIEQMADEHWFGHSLGDDVRSRLGDVALLPIGPHAFDDPADGGPFALVGRHGSLTAAEMLVPCLMASA